MTEPYIITAVGSAVIVLLTLLPVLLIFDKLKTDSLTAKIREKIITEVEGKQEKDASNLRKMIEDVIGFHLLRFSREVEELFNAKHDNTLEKFEKMNREIGMEIATLKGDVDRAKIDINNIAAGCRNCRNFKEGA